MKSETKNKEGGFIQIIIIIIVILLVMKYFGLTISGIIHWFVSFFNNVLK
jgi:flagellar basal body-associated protein FliL